MSLALPAVNSANRFAHIDALRAYAVLVVVLAHGGLGRIVPGGSGVTIFFSISGFIITYLLLRERDKTGGFDTVGFYLRRAFKILPPLLIAVALPSLIWALSNPIDWGAFLAQIFFVYNWWKVAGVPDVLPGTGVVWSLSIEEQFYIVFALIWLVTVRSRYWRQITVSLAVAGILWATVARVLLVGDDARIYYGSDTRLDGIAYGMLIAVAYHAWQSRGARPGALSRTIGSWPVPYLAVAVYLATLLFRDEWFRDTFRFTLQSLAACALILYGLMAQSGFTQRALFAVSRWKPVELIGLASYSIYLVHLTAIIALEPLLADLPTAARMPLSMVVGVAAGILMYYVVEKPTHRLRQVVDARRRARAVANADATPAPSWQQG